MKKHLLLLFILLQITAFSQVNEWINCDGNTVFDLTSREAILIGTQDPSEIDITYYTTTADAQDNTNAIANPSNYTVGSNTEIVYARVANNITNNFTVENLYLYVSDTIVVDVIVVSNDCINGAEITVSISGGNNNLPFTYALDQGSYQTVIGSPVTLSFFWLSQGIHTLEIGVGSSRECVVSRTIEIAPLDPIVLIPNVSGQTVTLNATGGSSPYLFSLDSGANQEISQFTNISLGFHCFTVQDSNGCAANVCLEITTVLDLESIGTYQDYNNDGFVNVGDMVNYNFTVTNNETLDATNITLDSFGLPNNGTTIATLVGGASDNSTFTASYVITQEDINTGSVTKNFQVNETYEGNPASTFTTNTTILSISDGIKLNAFIDSNGNNIQDNGEQNINVGSFEYQLNNGNAISVVSSTGIHYLYESNPLNTYNFNYVIDPAYRTQYTLSQNNYTNITVETNSGITTYNFPLTIIPYVDSQVYLNQYGAPPIPGFVYTERIIYRNRGNQTTSGTITFTKNNVVTITTVSESGITNTSNGFTYNFTNLLPYETRYIYVTMQTPTIPTVALGQVLTNNVTITIPSGDVNVTNNESTLSQIIVGSFDPNDKTEAHGGKIVHADFSSEDYLTYTIQFENTGTANAVTVKVDDVLDAMLDASTLKMLDASHDYVLKREENNLSWKFNGIDLPPSISNTTTGKGYIVFQIKPMTGYAIGDIIPNTANIYFDFNPAIVTNTFTTEFVETLSTQSFTTNEFLVYPNPMNEQVYITSKNNILIQSLNIIDVLGKTIYSENVNASETRLDVSSFQKGIYFLKMKTDEKEQIIKIVKQ